MSDFSYYFVEPCELVAIVYEPDGITELGRYSFRGYMYGMDHFFQICSLLAYEVAHSHRFYDTNFENFASLLRSSFYHYVKRGEVDSLESALRRHIEKLKQYKFIAQKIIPFLPESSATSLDRKRFEITVDCIFKWIQEMCQQRIIFYERILQEYNTRKDQYNRRLLKYLENKEERHVSNLPELDIDSILSELGVDSENHSNGELPEKYYEISNKAWYLKDLLELDDPEIE